MSTNDSTGARTAAEASETISLEESIHSGDPEILVRAASDLALTEDLALSLLKRADLPGEVLEALGRNSSVIQRRKVRFALVAHPRSPRHLSLPMLRHLYTFDLMQLALTPVAPADIKRLADELLVTRIETISSGERLSLARRGSGRIAAELLADKEARVMETALENGRLTESAIVAAVLRYDASAALVQAVCHHPRWSLRREVRMALLRNEKTPLARALEFAHTLPPATLKEILQSSRLPASTKAALLNDVQQRSAASPS
jgi:hypothetical protein